MAQGYRDNITPLARALDSRELELIGVRGDGSSSGHVLHGTLRNNTSRAIRVRVRLADPMYFENGNSAAQNMVATEVYERDLSYYPGNGNPFIEVRARDALPVTFNAYCVDFRKDNPSSGDRLSRRPIPKQYSDIFSRILAYERDNPDADTMVPAQIALWLARQETVASIATNFDFTPEQLTIARQILRSGS